MASTSTRDAQERDDASSAGGSASAQGWDVEQDLVDHLSNHGLTANGGASASRSLPHTALAPFYRTIDWRHDDVASNLLPRLLTASNSNAPRCFTSLCGGNLIVAMQDLFSDPWPQRLVPGRIGQKFPSANKGSRFASGHVLCNCCLEKAGQRASAHPLTRTHGPVMKLGRVDSSRHASPRIQTQYPESPPPG